MDKRFGTTIIAIKPDSDYTRHGRLIQAPYMCKNVTRRLVKEQGFWHGACTNVTRGMLNALLVF